MADDFLQYKKLYDERHQVIQRIVLSNTQKIDDITLAVALLKQRLVIYTSFIAFAVSTIVATLVKYFIK